MNTEQGLSNGVSRYDDDDTNLDFTEDNLSIAPDPGRWLNRDEDDDTDLEFEQLEKNDGHSLVTYGREPVRDTPSVFEVASYQLAAKCNISLIADGPVDREAIQDLLDQLTADLASGLFDKNPSN